MVIESDVTEGDVWEAWVAEYLPATDHTPLFETDGRTVQVTTHGRDDRPVLKRSAEMEHQLATAGQKVVADWQGSDDTYEGVIYLVYTIDNDEVVPRYVGKAGKYGRDGERLSANLRNVRTNRSKFARWGDGYAYHVGELSAAVLDHHTDPEIERDDPPKGAYREWVDALFVDGTRRLREPVYFWARAWQTDDIGPFYGFKTNLGALEYYLIDLASTLYPETLLNEEGT